MPSWRGSGTSKVREVGVWGGEGNNGGRDGGSEVGGERGRGEEGDGVERAEPWVLRPWNGRRCSASLSS